MSLKLAIISDTHNRHKEFNGVKYYNAANCTEQYQCKNPVTVVDYE